MLFSSQNHLPPRWLFLGPRGPQQVSGLIIHMCHTRAQVSPERLLVTVDNKLLLTDRSSILEWWHHECPCPVPPLPQDGLLGHSGTRTPIAGGFLNTHVLFHPNFWHRGQLKLTQGRTHSCDNTEN